MSLLTLAPKGLLPQAAPHENARRQHNSKKSRETRRYESKPEGATDALPPLTKKENEKGSQGNWERPTEAPA